MSAPPARFDVRKAPGAPGVTIIDLRGRLDAFAGEALDTAYAEVNQHKSSAIVLNFTHVDYINSTGIALIIGLMMQAAKTGRRLLACSLNEHYMKVFELARLTDFITIIPDEPSALSAALG